MTTEEVKHLNVGDVVSTYILQENRKLIGTVKSNSSKGVSIRWDGRDTDTEFAPVQVEHFTLVGKRWGDVK